MPAKPEGQPEWGRRVTDAVSATSYERLKTLADGLSAWLGSATTGFEALSGQLEGLERSLSQATSAIAAEAGQMRGAFAESNLDLADKLRTALVDQVHFLSGKVEEMAAQLVPFREETLARVRQFEEAQARQLAEARESLTEASMTIWQDVESAVGQLSSQIQAGSGTTEEALGKVLSAAGSLQELGEGLRAGLEESARALASLQEELSSAQDQARAHAEATADRVESALGRLGAELTENLRKATSAVAEGTTGVADAVRANTAAYAASFKDAEAALAAQIEIHLERIGSPAASPAPGPSPAAGADLEAVMARLDELLESRDRRLAEMLEAAASGLPAGQRAGFYERLRSMLGGPGEG